MSVLYAGLVGGHRLFARGQHRADVADRAADNPVKSISTIAVHGSEAAQSLLRGHRQLAVAVAAWHGRMSSRTKRRCSRNDPVWAGWCEYRPPLGQRWTPAVYDHIDTGQGDGRGPDPEVASLRELSQLCRLSG